MENGDINMISPQALPQQVDAISRRRAAGHVGTLCMTGDVRDRIDHLEGNVRFRLICAHCATSAADLPEPPHLASAYQVAQYRLTVAVEMSNSAAVAAMLLPCSARHALTVAGSRALARPL